MCCEGFRQRTLTTLHGKQAVKRRYFRCPICGHTEYPADQTLGLDAGKLSPRVTEKACLVATFVPFEQAADVLQRLTDISISPDCIENTAERRGSELCEQEREAAQSLAASKQNKALKADKISKKRVYFQGDGSMVNTREEKWKENKLAMAFDERDIQRSGSGENERVRILKKDFATSLAEGVDVFKNLVRLLAVRVQAFSAHQIVVISDGAVWIENMFAELFPNVIHIIDWFHAVEKLWKCANALHGEGSQKAVAWVEVCKEMLWRGHVRRLLRHLNTEAQQSQNQTPIRELYAYINTRRRMMRYGAFRRRGLFIGSGAIESANKYVVQDRLKRAGMRWTKKGANAIAHLRTAYFSDRWDDIWQRRAAA